MTTVEDGGAAFPAPMSYSPETGPLAGQTGMSLRDWFAGQVANGMAAHSGTAGISYGPHDIAGRSYAVADAMLKARAEEASDDD